MAAQPIKQEASPFNPPLGDPPAVQWLGTNDLSVDYGYQRLTEAKASQRLISDIATDWDWRLCAPLTVSDRGKGGKYVIDGQHRLLAAQMRGDIETLPCIVSVFGSFEEEARCFVSINSARRQVTPLERFHARIASKDESALAVKSLIEGAGLRVGRYADASLWEPKDVPFPDAVERTMRSGNSHSAMMHNMRILTALSVIGRAYPDKVLTGGRDLFKGLAHLLTHTGEMISDAEHLISVISSQPQRGWLIARDRTKLTATDEIGSSVAMARALSQATGLPLTNG